jgi:hypothetical protein
MKTDSDKILERVRNDEIIMMQWDAEELREVTEAALQEAQVGNWKEAFTMLWLVAAAKAKTRRDVQPLEESSSEKVNYEQVK